MNRSQSDVVACASRASTILTLLAVMGSLSQPVQAQISDADMQAQTSNAGANTNSDQALQEVVVTAERRESTVQKTPFSITAISGQQLESQGLTSMEDVAAQTVGVSMRTSGPGQTEYDMRGTTSSGGAFATTGFYLNDVPLASPASSFTGHVAIDPDLFDLNRIEVLRGPQGTLYGAGSMGGTVRLVTNEPNLNHFEGASDGTVGGTADGGPNWGADLMLNFPLVDDRLALRVVATDKYDDGWIDRAVVQPFPIGPGGACGWESCTRGNVLAGPVVDSFPRSNWERLSGARGELLFQATDSLTFDLLTFYQRITMGAFSEVDNPPGIDYLSRYQPFNIPEPFSDNFRIFAGTITQELGFANLTSATSYWHRDSNWTSDISENFQNFTATAFGFTPMVPLPYWNNDPSSQWSEELRLTSTGSGPFQWVVGGFFSNFYSAFQQYVANPAYAAISIGGPAANPLGVIYAPYQPYYIKQSAGFAEVSYQILPQLKATAGIRWYHYNSKQDSEQSGVFTVTGNASTSYSSVQASESGNNPKINLSYIPDPNLTIYAQAAKGFRPGGVNIPAPPYCTIQPSPSYAPDSLWDYEAGEKARLFDGRLQVNADFYYIVWKNVQEELNQTCGFPYTTNAGTAASYGPELELNAKVTDHLALSLSGTYTQAYLREVASGLGTLGAVTVLTPGTQLDNVPHYTVNASLVYETQVSGRFRAQARITSTTIGPQYDIAYYTQQLPGYTLLDLRVGLLGGALVPYLFVDNVTNRFAVTTINTEEWSIATPDYTRNIITTPRTFGLNLQYKF
jgi:iron complex outermembrane recepter protein